MACKIRYVQVAYTGISFRASRKLKASTLVPKTKDDESVARLGQLIRDGWLHYRENIVEGLENAPQAFIDLFEGKSFDKQLVQLAQITGQRLDPPR